MTKQTFINEQAAIDYVYTNTDIKPKTKEEYMRFLEENVYMSVQKHKNGRECFTVELPLSDCGRG